MILGSCQIPCSTYAVHAIHFDVILPLVAGLRFLFIGGALYGFAANHMLCCNIPVFVVFVGQYVVHLVADGAAQITLGHMEVAVLAIAHFHLIVNRLTCLLIIFRLLDAR